MFYYSLFGQKNEKNYIFGGFLGKLRIAGAFFHPGRGPCAGAPAPGPRQQGPLRRAPDPLRSPWTDGLMIIWTSNTKTLLFLKIFDIFVVY